MEGNDVQRKPGLFFVASVFLGAGLSIGCHSGPSHREDSEYRAIEREADRNSADLAITGADIAVGAERIDGRAERVKSELNSLETAVGESTLPEREKSTLLLHTSTAREEAEALIHEVSLLWENARRLNDQLAEQRDINDALSAEHDKREAAVAAVNAELAVAREKLAKVSGKRNLAVVIAAVLALAIAGYIVIRALRFLRIIPV
jgi:hypothetical protein